MDPVSLSLGITLERLGRKANPRARPIRRGRCIGVRAAGKSRASLGRDLLFRGALLYERPSAKGTFAHHASIAPLRPRRLVKREESLRTMWIPQ